MSGNGYVDSETKKIVEQAARELGYRRSAIARTLRTNRSDTVGILIADISNPIFPRIVKGADEVLAPEGMTLLLCNTEGDSVKQMAFVQKMLERQADGLILVSQSLPEAVTALLAGGPPSVFVNRRPDPDAFDYVGPDNVAGIEALLAHLSVAGHRHVGYIGGPENSSTARERLGAFQEAAPRFGIVSDPDLQLLREYDYGAEREGAAELLTRSGRITAIVASNDMAAMGVIAEARSRGLRVPEDLSVTGYDGAFREPMWESLYPDRPQLTTIGLPRRQIGVEAARLLLRRIKAPEAAVAKMILPIEMIAGNTTGPARPRS